MDNVSLAEIREILNPDRERRHLELLAATLHNSVSRTMDELLKRGGPLPDDDEWVVKEAVMTARAIQAEVRRTEGGFNDE